MPLYEFVCKQCKAVYEIRATVEEKQAGLNLSCRACGSTDLAQVFGGLFIRSSGQAEQVSQRCVPGSGCCGPRK